MGIVLKYFPLFKKNKISLPTHVDTMQHRNKDGYKASAGSIHERVKYVITIVERVSPKAGSKKTRVWYWNDTRADCDNKSRARASCLCQFSLDVGCLTAERHYPLNHIMDFASCCAALEESSSVQTWITGLTRKQLPLESRNVPRIRYANITDEYKNKHKKKTKKTTNKQKKTTSKIS